MNRMQRPPVISKTEPTKSVPKFGRPKVAIEQVEQEEPAVVVEQMEQPEKKVEQVRTAKGAEKKVNDTVLNAEDFKTKEFTVENSITVKIKDNFYKFSVSETKTVPEYASNDDVSTVKRDVSNELNKLLDEQIAELVDSL